MKGEKAQNSILSIGSILLTKKIALRRRVWFKTLTVVERSVLDLTTRYVDNIRSSKLATLVTAIIEKLQLAMENTLDRILRVVGIPLAQRISSIALSWGNRFASRWANDRTFARYLAMNFSAKLSIR